MTAGPGTYTTLRYAPVYSLIHDAWIVWDRHRDRPHHDDAGGPAPRFAHEADAADYIASRGQLAFATTAVPLDYRDPGTPYDHPTTGPDDVELPYP